MKIMVRSFFFLVSFAACIGLADNETLRLDGKLENGDDCSVTMVFGEGVSPTTKDIVGYIKSGSGNAQADVVGAFFTLGYCTPYRFGKFIYFDKQDRQNDLSRGLSCGVNYLEGEDFVRGRIMDIAYDPGFSADFFEVTFVQDKDTKILSEVGLKVANSSLEPGQIYHDFFSSCGALLRGEGSLLRCKGLKPSAGYCTE